jgi:phosphoribosyl-AMP cyclohydrolase
LQRATSLQTGRRFFIGKESDRLWEKGEHTSVPDFNAIEYERMG